MRKLFANERVNRYNTLLDEEGLSLATNGHTTSQNTGEHSKINICICTHIWLGLYHGGVDRIENFARNVSKNGVNVYLVDRSTKKSLSALILDSDKYYAIENGRSSERYYPFYGRFLFPGILKFLQWTLNLWFSLLTRTTISEVSYSYLIDPYLLVKLFFICKKERIDLIQCELPFPIFSSLIVKKIIGIPLIYDAHGVESERIGTMANVNKLHVGTMKKIEIMSCKICDSVFVVSESDRDRLLTWGVPGEKVTTIPNSVESDKFSPAIDGSRIRAKYGLSSSAFVMVFHGYFGYHPNREAAQILLDLFPSFLEKHDLFLLLIGRSPPITVYPNVITTGFVENIPEYIAAADLAVVPLLSGGGTKLKMLQYMACGKAIVSTVKAAEGLDLENETDILMCRYPGAEFTNLVLRAIEDSSLRKKMGINARKKVEEHYDWNQNAKKAVSIYRNLVCN